MMDEANCQCAEIAARFRIIARRIPKPSDKSHPCMTTMYENFGY
jgi:hypothetical protein